MKLFRKMWWLGLCVMAAGCIETKDEFVLNPDGSGRVRHEAVMQPMNLNLSSEEQSPEQQLKETVKKEIEKAAGIEVWKDVTFERTAEGKIRFQGTAYFKDLGKLKFHNGGFHQNMLKPSWTKNAEGRYVLELAEEKEASKAPTKPKSPPPTEQEIAAKMPEMRAQFQEMKPVLAMFAATKMDLSFRLPGVVVETNNLQKDATGTLQIAFRGEKFVDALEKMISDDAWVREQVKAGHDLKKNGPEMDVVMNEKLYGQKGPVRAIVMSDGKPQFNYAVEAAAAQKAYPDLMKKLGVVAPVMVTPASGGGLKSVSVGGVRLVRVSDSKRGVRPFNWEAGYALSIIAELPGSVLEVTGGKLEQADADNGESLMPKREFDCDIHFPQLSEDKTTAVFELKLALPGSGVKSLKTVAGHLTYLVAGKTKKVDTGITELVADAKGKELGAVIKSVGTGKWDKEWQEIEVKFQLPRHVIKEVSILDASGQPVKLEQRGSMGMGDATTLTLGSKSPLPKTGRVVVEMYEGLQKYETPFELKNISLTGEPLR